MWPHEVEPRHHGVDGVNTCYIYRLARDHKKSEAMMTQLEQKTVAQQAVIANTQQVGMPMDLGL